MGTTERDFDVEEEEEVRGGCCLVALVLFLCFLVRHMRRTKK